MRTFKFFGFRANLLFIFFLGLLVISYQNCGSEFKTLAVINLGSTDPGVDGCHEGTDCNPVVQKADYSMRLSDRRYLGSALESVFLLPSGSADETGIRDAIRSNILIYPQYLGGPCADHDTDLCSQGQNPVSAKIAESIPDSSPIREGLKTRACTVIVQFNGAVSNALTNVGLSAASPVNETNVAKVLKAFYGSRTLPAGTAAAFVDVDSSLPDGTPGLERWRMILYSICLSDSWQVL